MNFEYFRFFFISIDYIIILFNKLQKQIPKDQFP